MGRRAAAGVAGRCPRVGVFGGSFNPIHFGHLLVADEICEALCARPRAARAGGACRPTSPPPSWPPRAHRYRMTALAVREHPRFEVSDVELRASGPSYTVDTLTALQRRGDAAPRHRLGDLPRPPELAGPAARRAPGAARRGPAQRAWDFDPEAPAAPEGAARARAARLRARADRASDVAATCCTRRPCPSRARTFAGVPARAGASPTACPRPSSPTSASTASTGRRPDGPLSAEAIVRVAARAALDKNAIDLVGPRPAGAVERRRLLPRLQRALDDAGRHHRRGRAGGAARGGGAAAPQRGQRGERLAPARLRRRRGPRVPRSDTRTSTRSSACGATRRSSPWRDERRARD